MAFFKVGYLVTALVAVVAAMPPESPAPAAIRNTDLLQEETQRFSQQPQQYSDSRQLNPQYGPRDAYPNPEESSYPNSRDPSYSEQRDSPLEQRQRFNPQHGTPFGPFQGHSAPSELRPDVSADQRDYRDQSFEQEQDRFQNQNYGPNAFESPVQRTNEGLIQNPVQESAQIQQYSPRQDAREQFQGQRVELVQRQRVEPVQRNLGTESSGSGSFQNQRAQNQYSGPATPGARSSGIPGAQEIEIPTNQEFQRSSAGTRDSQRYDSALEDAADPDFGNYQYSYDIRSEDTGDMKYHKESRDGNKVIGEYRVKEADGSMRIVKYTADAENGFQATVEYVMDEEEPVEFGAKMTPKTSRPKNQRNFGNKRVFESSRTEPSLPSKDQSRFQGRPQSAKEDDMSLFFNPASNQGPVRSRPGFAGNNRGFQQPSSSRFDASFQETQGFQRDSQGFSDSFQGPVNPRVPSDPINSRNEFQEQEYTDRSFSRTDSRDQFQSPVESSFQDQSRNPSPFQNRDRQQFQDRDQFQNQERDQFLNQNRNQFINQEQERGQFQNQERDQFQNQNRNQFHNQERNQFQNQEREQFQSRERDQFQIQNRNQLQNQERNQFQNQAREQFQNQERDQFQIQNRNKFQNQERSQFQINERDQERSQHSSQDAGGRFQIQDVNQNQYQEPTSFQNQRRNPFQSQIQSQERNAFRNQERSRPLQGQDIPLQNHRNNAFQENERNAFQDQYSRDDQQFQQQRDQYELGNNRQFNSQFESQRNQQVNSQGRRVRPNLQARDQPRLQEANQFQNPIENRPVDQHSDGFQTLDTEFQGFNENQYSAQREEPLPSQRKSPFQNQNRHPVPSSNRQQFRGSAPVSGPQQQLDDQNLGHFVGQNQRDSQNRYQFQDEQRNRFDGQQPSSQSQYDGQRYGAGLQNRQFQGEGIYQEMNDNRYQSQRYGQSVNDFPQGPSNFNQLEDSQRTLSNPVGNINSKISSNFDGPQLKADIPRQGDNYQQNEQFSSITPSQVRNPAAVPNSGVISSNNFQDQFGLAGPAGRQSPNNFSDDRSKPLPTSPQFRNENFSQGPQGSPQDQRYGFQRGQEVFRPSQGISGVPQGQRPQRFETIAEPHPQI